MFTVFTNLYRKYELKDQALFSEKQGLELVRPYKMAEFGNIVEGM